MPLQAHNPMAVYCFNRFDGVITRIKGGCTEIWCKILDTLTVHGIDPTSLSKSCSPTLPFCLDRWEVPNGSPCQCPSISWLSVPPKATLIKLNPWRIPRTGLFWRTAAANGASSKLVPVRYCNHRFRWFFFAIETRIDILASLKINLSIVSTRP